MSVVVGGGYHVGSCVGCKAAILRLMLRRHGFISRRRKGIVVKVYVRVDAQTYTLSSGHLISASVRV